MAKKITSSPSPTDVRLYQEASARFQTDKTAFQSISTDVRLTDEARYADPYLKFLAASGDPLAATEEFNRLYAGLISAPASAGTKYPNAFEELQSLLRDKGLSKGKTAIGQVDWAADIPAMTKAIQASLGMGQTDVIQFLKGLSVKGTGPKQIDTTTKFTTQVNRALRLKDKGDAMRTLTDAYMLAYGTAPASELITDFEKKWNAELKAQIPPTTTRNVVKMVPVYDSKTGKQKIGKNGKPMFKPLYNAEGVKQYETVTTTDSSAIGEGFTPEEEKAFMANYIATNFPGKNWNAGEIGGAAKTIYDAIVQTNANNFEKTPTFQEVAPIITRIMGTGNEQVATELMQQYVTTVRNKASKRFMSLAPDITAGADAKSVANDYLQKASAAFESNVDVEDPFMLSVLNYKDEKGNYRLPNDFEFSRMILDDPRRGRTSAAINEAVNLAQSLQSQLKIG